MPSKKVLGFLFLKKVLKTFRFYGILTNIDKKTERAKMNTTTANNEKYKTPEILNQYTTEDLRAFFESNNTTFFLNTALERGRISIAEYKFLFRFFSSHNPQELTAADIYNLSNDDIYSIQKYFDEYSICYLEAALRQKLITPKEFDKFYPIYNNGMAAYAKVYSLCLTLFGSSSGVYSLDPKTGKLDTAPNGEITKYNTKVVTPFLVTIVRFQDKNANDINVMFPKIKLIHRTIDKLIKEIVKELKKQEKENKAKHTQKKRKQTQAMMDRYWQSEDREMYPTYCADLDNNDQQQQLPPIEDIRIGSLHDIIRLTITRKYLSGNDHTIKIWRKHQEKHGYHIETTRNRFDMPLYENEKKYYDIKLVFGLENELFDIEAQLKIDTLCMSADKRTYLNYKKSREILENITPNDPLLEDKMAIVNKLITENRLINENGDHYYNMMVLDKAQRWINDDLKHLYLKKPNPDGTYDECVEFIRDNYLVESYEAFNPQTAFEPDHYNNGKPINKLCFLRLIDQIDNTFDEFSPGADQIIEEKFNTIFDKSDPNKYAEFHNLRSRLKEITPVDMTSNDPNTKPSVAEIYSNVINEKINDRIIHDIAHAQVYTFESTDFKLTSPEGKICILKLLNRLPKDFPSTGSLMTEKHIETATTTYSSIFSNPKDKDNHLLHRLLKVVSGNDANLQKHLSQKMQNLISENNTNQTMSNVFSSAIASKRGRH